MPDPLLVEQVALMLGIPAEEALAVIRPALDLSPRPATADDLMTGATRSGGAPDLPASFEWPRNHGVPLAHVVQLDLAALPVVAGVPLPREGVLSLFYDFEDIAAGLWPDGRHAWHVTWFAPDVTLHATPPPPDLDPDWRWAPTGFTLSMTDTLPCPEALELQGLSESRDAEPGYHELSWDRSGSFQGHRIGGWWSTGQNDPRLSSEAAARATSEVDYDAVLRRLAGDPRAFDDWVLLFQLQSFNDPAGHWVNVGDSDHACFMMRREDLRIQAFDRARAIWVY